MAGFGGAVERSGVTAFPGRAGRGIFQHRGRRRKAPGAGEGCERRGNPFGQLGRSDEPAPPRDPAGSKRSGGGGGPAATRIRRAVTRSVLPIGAASRRGGLSDPRSEGDRLRRSCRNGRSARSSRGYGLADLHSEHGDGRGGGGGPRHGGGGGEDSAIVGQE